MTAANDFPWNEENVARLKHLVAEGLSASQIGVELGCSRNAAISKVHRIGLTLGGAKSEGRPKKIERTKMPPRARFNPFQGMAEKRLPIAPPLAPVEEEYTPIKGVTLFDRQENQCKWPINDGGPFLFCGRSRISSSPYCACHFRMAGGSGTPSERRATEAA